MNKVAIHPELNNRDIFKPLIIEKIRVVLSRDYGINFLHHGEERYGDWYEIYNDSKFSLFMLKYSEYIIKIYE